VTWTTTWLWFFDSLIVNINLLIIALAVFCTGLYKRRKNARTSLFWIAFLIAFVGVAYWTLHGRLLQAIFPIALPENPFDPLLIANYVSTVVLTFAAFPLLFLYLSKQLDTKKLGLRIDDMKQTVRLTLFGACISIILTVAPVLISILASREYKWPFEPTALGLTLWFVLVTGLVTAIEVLFFFGILLHNHLDSEDPRLLFLVSALTFLMFIPLSIHTPFFLAGLAVEAYITIKTHNIYGAMCAHILGVVINTVLVI